MNLHRCSDCGADLEKLRFEFGSTGPYPVVFVWCTACGKIGEPGYKTHRAVAKWNGEGDPPLAVPPAASQRLVQCMDCRVFPSCGYGQHYPNSNADPTCSGLPCFKEKR